MPEIHLTSSVLFSIAGWPVTNSILTTWIGMAVLVGLALVATRQVRLVPSGIQNGAEGILELLLGLMEQVLGSREKAERSFPFLATFFFFILMMNWMELIPTVLGGIELETARGSAELFRSANSDLNTPLALALISVLGTQVAGISTIGLVRHASHYVAFKPTFEGLIGTFVGILHIVGEFARVLSFTFRLFGNVFAGEVLLIVMTYLVPYLAPIPFYGLELFVGLIQALVFTMLTMVFLATATIEVEHHS
ncbi:F0F1 ATP synthase subunit A [Candidatus Berkelbacteria bacterium]|nr:F0F1 ATP synthase subunit A [Candidatus Berkelbacteria bacterium]